MSADGAGLCLPAVQHADQRLLRRPSPGRRPVRRELVCLDATTGKRVWHFQIVHHGVWDYDLPAAPILLDITVDGRHDQGGGAGDQAGRVFVFDRWTGEPVWPIEERAGADRGPAPGESCRRRSRSRPSPRRSTARAARRAI